MHFAKVYAEAARDLPEEWKPYLISYRDLKKCIGRIVSELEGRGLSVELLKGLREQQESQQPKPETSATPKLAPPASFTSQVLHHTSKQKWLYTFKDPTHPCISVVVADKTPKNESERPVETPSAEAPSNEPKSVATPPTPSVHASTGGRPSPFKPEEAPPGSPEDFVNHTLLERLTNLDIQKVSQINPFISDDLMAEDANSADEEDTASGAGHVEQSAASPENQHAITDDAEEDRRHEERERQEFEFHFTSKNLYAPPPNSPTPAMKQKHSSPDHARATDLHVDVEDQMDSSLMSPSRKDADEKREEKSEDTGDEGEDIPVGENKRRKLGKTYTTIYSDDGEAVRIATTLRHKNEHPLDKRKPATNEGLPDKIGEEGLDATDGGVRVINVTLRTDVDFFNTIVTALDNLSTFQDNIKIVYQQRITRLADLIGAATTPHASSFGFGKSSDLYVWRDLFDTFGEQQIWFDDDGRPVKGESAKTENCRARLKEWERIVTERCLPKLKLRKSKIAFIDFLKLNNDLVAMKQFRELNKMAIEKILKKHDKRTLLVSKSGFKHLIATNPFMKEGLTHGLSFAIKTQLSTIVPQPQDYNCPVCLNIAWKPIRLICGHLFCVRCLIKAQMRKMTNCPMCRRHGSITDATAGNLDVSTMALMQLYFPKEIKEKRRENAKEILDYR